MRTMPAIMERNVAFIAFSLLLTASVRGQSPGGDVSVPPPPSERAVAPVPLDPRLPTLFVVGDSTAASNDGVALGWGVPSNEDRLAPPSGRE